MKIYLDTEFTSLHKDANLISIGLISEDGKEFYGEFASINTEVLDQWIKDNVLANTIKYGDVSITDIVLDETNYHYGTREEIKEQLENWLSQFEDIEIISDVCHYDYVLFIDIFGGAFDLPQWLPACCFDINQEIARFYHISSPEAFDISREELLKQFGQEVVGKKHNSLYDAKVIKSIYEIIEGN